MDVPCVIRHCIRHEDTGSMIQEKQIETLSDRPAPIRTFRDEPEGFRWEDVPVKEYKPSGSSFKDVTRQVLFDRSSELTSQVRYFEIAPGGYSTLEKHVHVHAVLILRGQGHVLVGDTIHQVSVFDLVYVPPKTWHQFRADENEPLGFLCLVPCDRDKPIRPNQDEINTLRSLPDLDAFIRI